MGDQDQCHRNKENRRPLLTLAGERCQWTGQPIANYKIRARLEAEAVERKATAEAARKRAEERKRLAQERREVRERIDVARAVDDQRFAERRREMWIALVREATEIGLKTDPKWTEREFRQELWYKKQEIRREEEKRARDEYWAEDRRKAAEQQLLWQRQLKEEAARFLSQVWEWSVARNQELKHSVDPDELGDLWDHIPHVVKFEDFDRGDKFYRRGDLAKWNCYWVCRGRNRRLRTQNRLRKEYEDRTGHDKLGGFGKGPRNPQKQPRTWEAAAPRQWRRKDHCASRWEHLFVNDPAAE